MTGRALADAETFAASCDWIDLFRARLGNQVCGPAECEAVQSAYIGTNTYRRGDTIVHRGHACEPLHLVVSGWAAQLNVLEDGTQQITGFVLPGELCDLARLTDGLTEHATALTPASVVLLDRAKILEAIDANGKLGRALLRLALSELAISREWLLCLGSREKREHLAHLLCELHLRLRRAGLAADHEFELPLTQDELADAMGVSPEHTNRVLQRLRKEGLISLGQRHLKIHRPGQLREIGEFDGAYLGT